MGVSTPSFRAAVIRARSSVASGKRMRSESSRQVASYTEVVLVGECDHLSPNAGRGHRFNLDGQGFQAGADMRPLVRPDASAASCDKQHTPDFNRPEGWNECLIIDERITQPLGCFGCLVRKHPCHGNRAIEDKRHQYLRASSMICRTESPPREWVFWKCFKASIAACTLSESRARNGMGRLHREVDSVMPPSSDRFRGSRARQSGNLPAQMPQSPRPGCSPLH